MRPLEFSLGILCIFYSMTLIVPVFPAVWKYRIIPGFLGLIVLFQILIEGFRWQLWPLYIAVLTMLTLSNIKQRFRGQRLVAWIAIAFASISLLGGYLFPIPEPYPITGPYQIGTQVIHLVDPNRAEIYGSELGEPREFMAQVWYPATPGENERQAQWMADIEYAAPAIAGKLNLPSFTLDHLKYVRANAFVEAAPISDQGKFPVLIFSHGWEGFKEQNIFQVEELASHGYVVIGINHTYGAVLTVFPDGEQLPTDQEALPDGVPDEEYDLASQILVRQWAGDIGWVLDDLKAHDQGTEDWFLKGLLDLEKVGVFGHSTGAGATIEFCLLDPRCKAALVMDLWAEPAKPEIMEVSLSQPVMIMESEDWYNREASDPNNILIETLAEKASNHVSSLVILGTKHYDFSSLPMLSPLAGTLGLKGPIDGELILEIINTESRAFFDIYLNGDQRANLEQISQEYPEVLWGVRP